MKEHETADWPARRSDWSMWPFGGFVRWESRKREFTLARPGGSTLIIKTTPRLAAFRRNRMGTLISVEPPNEIGLKSIMDAAAPVANAQLCFPFDSERRACADFLGAVGVDWNTLKRIEAFPEDVQFILLRAASWITDFARLLVDAPALAFVAADLRLGKATWEIRKTIAARRYRDVLNLFGFTVSPRVMAKIPACAVSAKRLLSLRHVALTDKTILRFLRHAPCLNRHILDVLVACKEHPKISQWLGPGFFMHIASAEPRDCNPAQMLTELVRLAGRLRMPPVCVGSVMELQRLGVRMRKQLERRILETMTFPCPPEMPYLQTENVKLRPLRTPRQLLLHSDAQKVCAADYLQDVISGWTFFLSGIADEGTITVRLSRGCQGAWHVTAIVGYRNRRVSNSVENWIIRWAAESQGLDVGRMSERFGVR